MASRSSRNMPGEAIPRSSCSHGLGDISDSSNEDQQRATSTTYVLGVPLSDEFHCRVCAPIPKIYKRHGDLSKHLKKYHPEQQLVFSCNTIFNTVKACKLHQSKTAACVNAPQTQENLPQVPTAITGALQVQRSRFIRRNSQQQTNPAQDQPSTSTANNNQVESYYNGNLAHLTRRRTGSANLVSFSQSASPLPAQTSPSAIPRTPPALTLLQPAQTTPPAMLQTTPPANQITALQQAPILINNPEPQATTNNITEAQRQWTKRFKDLTTAAELESCVNDLVIDIKSQHSIATKNPTTHHHQKATTAQNQHGRRRNPLNADNAPAFDPAKAARIQKLWRSSRKRAYREIIEQSSPFCNIDGKMLFQHFTHIFGPSRRVNKDFPEQVLILTPLPDDKTDPLSLPFSIEEVSERLKHCNNTTPGPDGIGYTFLKKYDSSATILTALYNAVQRLQHIPSSWRTSTTILLHKKGDQQEISNWRPIALANTIGKLYSSVIAYRLSQWAVQHQRVSSSQKGFMPVDGCSEHNFILQSVIQDARRNHACIAWLDLTNAFGSIPHDAIFSALKWSGLNKNSIDVIRLLYNGNTTSIRHSGGLTDLIHLQSGVKQGCPLSPIVFNLALQPIIAAVEQLHCGYNLVGRLVDNETLYLTNAMGGMGLLPLNIFADISQLVHGARLLTSRDVADTAQQLLITTASKRLRRLPTQKEISEYLNGSMEGEFNQESTDVSNTWSRIRQATRRLITKINITWKTIENSCQLTLNGSPLNSKPMEYSLRSAIRDHFHRRLLAKPDQGKVHSVTSVCTASNHFMRDGRFTRFADWRFIHRARLDCVPLNGARRFGNNNKQCRRCGYANETLPHVLCHCPPNLLTITRRHNDILNRLVKPLKLPSTTDFRINQTVPGFPDNIRPDIVALDNTLKTAIIIDVTTPFENRYQGFDEARKEKRTKYDALADHFKQQGLDVFLDAFIVGALGGWDPHNEIVLRHLGIPLKYSQLMRRLMVSDCIRWSRDIYIEHITGKKQYSEWSPEANEAILYRNRQ